MLDVPCPVDGNEACIRLIEQCAQTTKEGEVAHICVILTRSGTDTVAYFSGRGGLEIASFYGAHLLQKELMTVNQNRMVTLTGRKEAPANRVFYNLIKQPVCFDFLGPLMD